MKKKNNQTPEDDPGRKEYFDKRADNWDNFIIHIPEKIEFILSHLEVSPGNRILDVGTGTGILIPFLYQRMQTEDGKMGHIDAVDYSNGMIRVARQKHSKEQFPIVDFYVEDIYEYCIDEKYDHIICYSCFPHFPNKLDLIQKLTNGLSPKGKLIIAHSDSRQTINNIHLEAGEDVVDDDLPPMNTMIEYFKDSKLKVIYEKDDEEYFIIIGKKE